MHSSRITLLLALLSLLASAQVPGAQVGGSWASLDGGLGGEAVRAFAFDPNGLLHVGGALHRFDVGFARLGSWDGVAWHGIGPFDPEDPNGTFYDVSFGPDGRLYVAGGIDRLGGKWVSSLAVWDGVVWLSVGGGVHNEESDGIYGGEVYVLGWGPGGALYAGGDFNRVGPVGGSLPAGLVASWDGSAWSAVGGVGLGSEGSTEVRALVFGPDGRLYAGGKFSTADGLPVANVAAWDGNAWDDLDGGLPGAFGIAALTFGPDGRLYAAGEIGVVAGIETDLAAWDGTAWVPVGPELETLATGGIGALAFSTDGKLYAGGNFDLPASAPGGTSRDVARLDGYLAEPGAGTWAGMDGGIQTTTGNPDSRVVRALAVGPNGEVYVGGRFDAAGPAGLAIEAVNVAVWLGDYIVGAEEAPEAEARPLSVSPNPVPVGSAGRLSRAVRGDVVDVLGRVVGRVDGDRLPGGLPAGVYAVVTDPGERTAVVRFTVAR